MTKMSLTGSSLGQDPQPKRVEPSQSNRAQLPDIDSAEQEQIWREAMERNIPRSPPQLDIVPPPLPQVRDLPVPPRPQHLEVECPREFGEKTCSIKGDAILPHNVKIDFGIEGSIGLGNPRGVVESHITFDHSAPRLKLPFPKIFSTPLETITPATPASVYAGVQLNTNGSSLIPRSGSPFRDKATSNTTEAYVGYQMRSPNVLTAPSPSGDYRFTATQAQGIEATFSPGSNDSSVHFTQRVQLKVEKNSQYLGTFSVSSRAGLTGSKPNNGVSVTVAVEPKGFFTMAIDVADTTITAASTIFGRLGKVFQKKTPDSNDP